VRRFSRWPRTKGLRLAVGWSALKEKFERAIEPSTTRVIALGTRRFDQDANGEPVLLCSIPAGQAQVRGDIELVERILAFADGERTVDDIVRHLAPSDRSHAPRIIRDLITATVLCTSETVGEWVWHLTANDHPLMSRSLTDDQLDAIYARARFSPVPSPHAPCRPDSSSSSVFDILSARRSLDVLADAAREPVTAAQLVDLARHAYGNIGVDRKTVPSAGALWPLALYLLVSRADRYEIWGYDDANDDAEPLGTVAPSVLCGAFYDEPPAAARVDQGDGILVIAADLERVCAKYGSRGSRYALIEAGAAMQNAYLAAAERGLGIRAIGGFSDHALRSILFLTPSTWPVLALLVSNLAR
jgi:SagB-type dehydrogenase family enzyme